MKKLIFIFIIMIFVVNNSYAKTYTVNEQTNTLNVKKGDKIIVKLNENQTTGYSWIFYADEKKLKELERKYIAPKTNLVGVGGYTYYKLKAIKKGQANINGIYKRLWENNNGIDSYKLQIKIL